LVGVILPYYHKFIKL